jgi:hypothetical protein
MGRSASVESSPLTVEQIYDTLDISLLGINTKNTKHDLIGSDKLK